jgi:hypothetical protein
MIGVIGNCFGPAEELVNDTWGKLTREAFDERCSG